MAGNLNKVMLIGHLGRDPEIRYTKDGTAVANLRIATSEQWTDKAGEKQEKTEWHTVVLWRRQAEIANEYLQKGSLIYVEGRLETRKWQDQAGADRYTTEITGQMFQMLGPRGGGGGGGERSSERSQDEGGDSPRRSGPPRTGSAPPRRSNSPSSAPPPDDDQGPPPEEDDIPF